MRIAVIGATGRTGRLVVEQALARGEDVVALARTPDAIELRDPRLTVARADVLEPATVSDPLAGADAVVSALGIGNSRSATNVYSTGVRNILDAMSRHRIRRLAVISGAPAGPRAEQPFAQRRIAMPILELFFGASYADMRRMEAVLQESDQDWVSLRPPRLMRKPAAGSYRLDLKPLKGGSSITHADLATALLDVLERDDLTRKALYVAN
jgi:putative NADH-flavin reductase